MDNADPEAGADSWAVTAHAARRPLPASECSQGGSPPAPRPRTHAPLANILDHRGKLRAEYFHLRARNSRLIEAGLDPYAPQRVVPDYTGPSAIPVPRSKRLSVLAVRGFRDHRKAAPGVEVQVSASYYRRAAGLDPTAFSVRNVGRVLRERPQSRWQPLDERRRPPPAELAPPPDAADAARAREGETFHQWYLRERRRECAQVDVEQFHAVGVEDAEQVARQGILAGYGEFASMCILIVTPRKNNALRLEKALSYAIAHRRDPLVTCVALRALNSLVTEPWSSAQFAAAGGVPWLATVLVWYRAAPGAMVQAAKALHRVSGFLSSPAQIVHSGIIFPLLDTMWAYKNNAAVLRELVGALHALVSKVRLTDFAAVVGASKKGLALVVSAAVRRPGDARFLTLALNVAERLSVHPHGRTLLVHRQGVRWLLGALLSSHYSSTRLRSLATRMLLALAAADRSARPALDLQGSCYFLLDTLRLCLTRADTDSETGLAEEARRLAHAALDALMRFVASPHDRSSSSCAHAAPHILGQLQQLHPEFAVKTEQVALRLRGAAPLVTAQSLSLGVDPVLFTLFRPYSELELLHQVLPDDRAVPPLPADPDDASAEREASAWRRDSALTYSAVVHPLGEQALVRCYFGAPGGEDCVARQDALSELRARAGVAHPALAGLLCWSSRDCSPLLPGDSAPRGVRTVYYLAMACGGDPLQRAALQHRHGDAGVRAEGSPSQSEAATPGLTYGDLFRTVQDCAAALGHLHGAGQQHGDLRLAHLRDCGGVPRRCQLYCPQPRALPRDPVAGAAAQRRDVRCLGRVAAELLFASSEQELARFMGELSVPVAPVPKLVLNAILAPCFGRPIDGAGGTLGDPDAPPASYSAADAFCAAQDCLALAALRDAYRGSPDLEDFCDWVQALSQPPDSPGRDQRLALQQPPGAEDDTTGSAAGEAPSANFSLVRSDRLLEQLEAWGCIDLTDIPGLAQPLPRF